MGLIGWIVLGAIAGWIASLINKTNQEQGWIGNIVLGIVGALVGGFLWNLITGSDNVIDFSIGSLIIAVIGALIVSWAFSMITRRRGA
ncbi:MAG: GlsB/YeaQ/YmgE family stress response membrane protein [Thermomicrobiales bacterium]